MKIHLSRSRTFTIFLVLLFQSILRSFRGAPNTQFYLSVRYSRFSKNVLVRRHQIPSVEFAVRPRSKSCKSLYLLFKMSRKGTNWRVESSEEFGSESAAKFRGQIARERNPSTRSLLQDIIGFVSRARKVKEWRQWTETLEDSAPEMEIAETNQSIYW